MSVVALADLIEAAAPHPRSGDLLELADDAPTLHLYVVDLLACCAHLDWRDPGHEEWIDAVAAAEPGPPPALTRRAQPPSAASSAKASSRRATKRSGSVTMDAGSEWMPRWSSPQ